MRVFGWFWEGKRAISDLTCEYEVRWTDYLARKYDRNDRWPQCLVVRGVLAGAGAGVLADPRIEPRHRKIIARAIKRRRFSPWESMGWDDEDEETAKRLQREYVQERKERLGFGSKA